MFHSNTNGTQNVNEKAFCERYPLHRACRDGDLQTLALFVATTGDRQRLLEEDSFYGWTPLHWAAYFGKISCLMQVCEAGIGIDIKTRFRQTASHIAAFSNAGNGLKWLLQNAAPINEQLECLSKLTNLAEGFNFDIASSHFSQTLLHIVAFKGYLHCLQWLLQVGANSNKQDHLGETPLHKAARTGSMECLSLLSSAGANILITNNNGLTASNLAAIAGNTEASEYLKQMEDCHPNPNGFRNSFDKTAFLNGSFNEKDFIKQGLNGGHLPECVIWNGICQRNGIPTNGHCEMSVNLLQKQNPQPNGFCSINGMNGHTKNGFSFPQPMMGGCKRPYEDRIQEEVKRIRTVEGFQSQAEYRCAAFYSNGHKKPTLPMHNSVVEHQAIMAMESNYNMYAYSMMITEMHGS